MFIQDYLSIHTIDELKMNYGIEVKEYPDRIVLNYTFDSPKHHPVTQECRALILERGTWKVLSRAFDRFYNYAEEPDNKSFDITSAIVMEKVDGSLIQVYNDGKQWNCSTRSCAFAEGYTSNNSTFREVVEKAFKNNGYNVNFLTGDIDDLPFGADNTYIFEVVSPETRVVHPYPKTDLYLLGMRNKTTGKELEYNGLKGFGDIIGIKTPKIFTFTNFDTIFESLKSLPQLDEGYVCVSYKDDRVWRIKVKNPSYLAIAHLRCNGALSEKRIAHVVFEDCGVEYLSYFPEDAGIFTVAINAYNRMIAHIVKLKPLLSMESQKEFAMKVKDTPIGCIMFGLRKNRSFKEICDNLTDEHKEAILSEY